ncbi:MAG: flagellar rod assembly protein/muramidase FlgJ [Nitrosospira sp. 56-18]|jgi:flagellar protein FlgJ|nr:flagellar assembly peptidoglycan hydrolase FlgJ [Nitrosospira sp.]OJY15394.1 MAG: flagellar rod assembly protein/muramidase FlgJ [Nitrosospira sp. 56-18]
MALSADLSGKLALDVQAVDGLRLQARKTDKAGLEAAARQFEALFMNMMLKSMREATPQDSLMDNDQSRLYVSMLDQQLAQSMAARGVGLADMMVQQLSRGMSAEAADISAQAAQAGARDISAPSPAGAAPQPLQAPATQDLQGTQAPQALQQSLRPQWTSPQSHLQDQPAEFQARLMPHAQAASQITGIPAQFMLGQAALETGWGRREIRAADGTPSHNLFGVKAGANWKGAVVEAVTTEYVNGVAQKSVEKFRAYDSYADAFRDYANLLRSNPRYAGIMDQAARGLDADGFAHGLQRAGYATDPNYADKLSRIIKTTPWS